MITGNQWLNTYSIVVCALFTALIAVGAFLRIPTSSVPVTLQMTFVLLAGMMLGSKRGAISAFVYLAVGLMGLPVFALGGGPAYLLQPTFGYIIGFIPGAYLAGKVVEKADRTTYKSYLLAGLAGLSAVYFIGLVYFYFISRFYLNRAISLWYLLLNGFLLTLPSDLIFCLAGALLAKRMKPVTAAYLPATIKKKK